MLVNLLLIMFSLPTHLSLLLSLSLVYLWRQSLEVSHVKGNIYFVLLRINRASRGLAS